MGKISDRHKARMEKPRSDWKDSRIVVAALSAAGTATFMSTVVIPITTASLTAKLEELAPAETKIRKLENDLAESKAALATAKAVAAEATSKTPFIPGSVYPVGLDKIRIGATYQQVIEAYPNGKLHDEGYFSAATDHALFSDVTYYFDGIKKDRKVSQILFHPVLKSPLNNEAMRTRFAILFGPPSATGRNGRTWWKATSRESIEMDRGDTYTVRAGSSAPYWVNR